MKKVCFFGIYDLGHSRIRMLKAGFVSYGYDVIECNVNPREISGLKKYAVLFREYKKLNKVHKFDCVLVGFPGYFVVFLARFLTNRPIIFDAYISYFDGIRDRKNYSFFNPKLWYAWLIDFLNGLVSDIDLTINFAYRDFFVRSLKVASRKVEVLHKGADETIFFPRSEQHAKRDNFVVGWWGSFIPLHGLPIIIDAARILRDRSDIKFHIIGSKGQLREYIESKVIEYGLSNVSMHHFLPLDELLNKVASFDVALGIFNPLPKSQRCVTNKVFEAIAMGKTVITEDSPANREIFRHKETAFLVPAGNPEALAQAIVELAKDRSLCLKIGQSARDLFEEHFTTEKISLEVKNILSKHNL